MKKVKQFNQKKNLTPEQALQFLEDYTTAVHGQDAKTRAISIRIPENILNVFKQVCESKGIKYQIQIVRLMREWLVK